MPAHRKEIAPALVAEGRRLYEQTMVPVREIAALCGVSPTTLQDRIVAWGWQRRRRPQLGEGGEDFGEEVRAKHAWH